ncbi:MAG: phage tail sheath family protein [Deltaproteobacteria bacterium]|nr:phage tail sheath family protein [Deltaproteobacteria bacterium]
MPTSTTIFVGETERGPIVPTKIKGRREYERLFGGYQREVNGGTNERVLMPLMMDGFFQNGGGSCYILRALDDVGGLVKASRSLGGSKVAEAAYEGFWGNSVSVVFAKSSDDDAARWRMVVFYKDPTTSKTSLVEDWDKLSANASDPNFVVDVLQRSLFIRWPDGVTAKRPLDADLDVTALPATRTALENAAGASVLAAGSGGGAAAHLTAANLLADHLPKLEGIDDAALLVAAAEQLLDDAVGQEQAYKDITKAFVEYCRDGRPKQDLFFIGDLPRLVRSTVSGSVKDARAAKNGITSDHFSAVYWPHIQIQDPIGAGINPTLVIPPAGHIAGIFARTDGRRGVWKAPAGLEAGVGGIKGLDLKLLDAHSADLNPVGVNALRNMPGAGSVVWGARTMMPATEWRYVPVRRTAIFLRMSIYNSIQWAVFEPNDEPLWSALRTSIGAFMKTQFRNGAFAGRTDKEAYFVKCDSETTPEADQIAGIVNVLVGFAPLRPAEFVVVKLSQITQGAS